MGRGRRGPQEGRRAGPGPFKLGPYETGVRYALVKNPDYWESPYPYLDRIELSTVGKDDVRVQALQTGSVDLAEYIPWQEIKALEKDPQIKVHVGYDTFNVIRMNPKRPPFDNVKVRQALNYLVDRKEIIELAWGGIGRPFGAGLIPDGHWAFPRALQGTWSYDPGEGQAPPRRGRLNPGATRIVFDSTTLSVHMDSAQIIVTQLQKVGFTQIELKPMDVPTQQRKRVSGEYQLMMDGFSLPWPDPDFYTAFFATGGASYARAVEFSDAALDKLLAEGRGTRGPGEARGGLRAGRAAGRGARALGVPPLAAAGRGAPRHHRRLHAAARRASATRAWAASSTSTGRAER